MAFWPHIAEENPTFISEFSPMRGHRQAAVLAEGALRNLGSRRILAALVFGAIDHGDYALYEIFVKANRNQGIATVILIDIVT